MPVDPASLSALPHVIGAERLAPYLATCGQDASRAIRLYCWNIEASSALLGTFAAVEVGVRNAMHRSLSEHHGRPDWWVDAPLTGQDRAAVVGAGRYLDQRRGSQDWTPGHLVAELPVSFWEGLLANRYHQALWVPSLAGAFPHFDGRRRDVKAQLQRLRLLRNRAAHHEPIHSRDLRVDLQYLCQLAGYVSAELRVWVESHSLLPRVVDGKSASVAGLRATRF